MVRSQSPWERREERGFTLIELMVVVAVIAILAAVAVPMFTRESKKVKAKTEVSAMFAELATKEERYRNELSTYLAMIACPSAPVSAGTPSAPCATGTWAPLGVNPPENTVRCSYQVFAGLAADNPTTFVPVGVTFAVPAGCCGGSWYMLYAKCDTDGNGTFSHYMTASFDASIQVTNEGQ